VVEMGLDLLRLPLFHRRVDHAALRS
jgi:hypothetical protein